MSDVSIMRSEAIKAINNGLPFDLEFVSADRRRGTGGDYIKLKKWMKLREDLPTDTQPRGYHKKFTAKKDSANDKHKTFRVFNPENPDAHPITVHYRLMQVLNGKSITNG